MKKKNEGVNQAAWYKLPGSGQDANSDDMLKNLEKQRKKSAKADKWYIPPGKKMPKLREIFCEQLKPAPISEEDVDPEELKMGIEIEKEHTDDLEIAKTIALQHLAEDPKYYTKLKKMEQGFTKKEGQFFSI